MKKLISTAAIALLAVSPAFAQSSSSDTLTVGSNVTEECNANAVGTGLNVTFAFDQVVGELTIECNVQGEITLAFGSPDGVFELTNSAASAAPAIPYSLDVEAGGAGIFSFTSIDNEGAPFTTTVSNDAGEFLTPQPFEIRLNVDSEEVGGMFAGSYNDVITIDLSVS